MSPEQFQQQLLTWFSIHGRKDLPWQRDINPYRVWLSEIMLQQTQVSTVIPYFNRFISRFPRLQDLADAELDEVLGYWSGLGYYARARNLHKTAGIIMENGGEFPRTLAGLSQLPGIGRSTAGAILSIACGQSEPILDGNVKRVLARFHAIGGWSGDSAVASKLWEISAAYTPTANTGAYTQAMMDLGATLCTRGKPKCESCPVAAGCRALALDRVNVLPEPKPRKNLPVKQVYFLILQNAGEEILLEKRPPTGIWGGLWSLPEFSDFQQLRDWCMTCNFSIGGLKQMESQRHTFSHYHLDYTPILAQMTNPINKVMEANAGVWYKPSAWGNLGMPSPIKRLLQQYDTEVNNDKNG